MNKKINNKLFIRVILPIILLLVLILIGYFSISFGSKNLSKEEAGKRAINFINTTLMQSGNKASLKEITSEYGLYKLKIDIVNDVVDSYISKDGKLFFPQALNIKEISQKKSASQVDQTNSSNTAPKSDKPTVKLFVMSYCPYGTQMEKGILPVLATLKNKINFQLEFVDYAMHGEKEINENLLQHCIEKEDGSKLNSYLSCFLKDGKSDECLNKNKINIKKVNKCVSATDKEYKVSENYKNKKGYRGSYPGFDVNKTETAKYSVNGSPTLIINDTKVTSGRDSASLLETICNAFNNAPKECETKLSNTSPAPGFGSAASTSGGTNATCN